MNEADYRFLAKPVEIARRRVASLGVQLLEFAPEIARRTVRLAA